MSRPGYPKISYATSGYVNYYYRAIDGATFSGIAYDNYRTFAQDKAGPNTPGWPQNIQDNLYTNEVYKRRDHYVDVNGFHTNGDRVYGQWPSSLLDNGWDPYSINSPGQPEALTALRNRINAKLIARVKDSQVNIAQAVAERDQTAKLVGTTARRLANTVTSLRRGNIPAALNALFGSNSRSSRSREVNRLSGLSGVPEQWLALQYGWKPLLSDIDGACKELASLMTNEPPACSAKARGTVTLDPYEYTARGSGYPIHPGRKWVRSFATIRGEGYVEYAVSSEFGQAVQRTGIIDPYLLAWELMPWSFVVDWFLPVGTWLEGLQFDAGLVFKRGYFSWKLEDRWTVAPENQHSASSGWNIDYIGGVGSTEAMYFNREVLTHGLSPPPPSLKNPFSLTHMANGLSLLAVAFGGKSGSRPIYR